MKLKTSVPPYGTPFLVAMEAMMLFVLTSCGAGTSPTTQVVANLPVPSMVQNTVPVTVDAYSDTSNNVFIPNRIYTSVTVCTPAVYPVGQNPIGGPPPAPTCQTINNILVDTGSVGLRLLDNGVSPLPVVTDGSNHPLQECVQFADFTYVWGPVVSGTVQMAGESAAQVPLGFETADTGIPIQIIATQNDLSIGSLWGGAISLSAVPSDCLSSPPSGGLPTAANTLETLGANGILGVGVFLQDCGLACASTPPPKQYYYCPSGLCSVASVPQDLQLWNPVAAFAYDNNGLLLSLPQLPPANGSAGITGSLIFGIGTQANNALGEASILPVDAYGNFPEVTLNYTPINAAYPTVYLNYLSPQNGSYIDSGTPSIYFSDAQSLGPTVPNCQDYPGLYCPMDLTYFTANVYGTDKTHTQFGWNILSADTLLNSENCMNGNEPIPCSVFNDLGGGSGIDSSPDYVDFGVPFFLGKNVFVGFAGTALLDPEQQVFNYTNGYWAF